MGFDDTGVGEAMAIANARDTAKAAKDQADGLEVILKRVEAKIDKLLALEQAESERERAESRKIRMGPQTFGPNGRPR